MIILDKWKLDLAILLIRREFTMYHQTMLFFPSATIYLNFLLFGEKNMLRFILLGQTCSRMQKRFRFTRQTAKNVISVYLTLTFRFYWRQQFVWNFRGRGLGIDIEMCFSITSSGAWKRIDSVSLEVTENVENWKYQCSTIPKALSPNRISGFGDRTVDFTRKFLVYESKLITV